MTHPAPSLLQTAVGRFRLVSAVEGLSTLLLFGVAMPLKYLADIPEAVRIVGSAHGFLFLCFVPALALAVREARWGLGTAARFFVLSMFPFGAVVIELGVRSLERGPKP
jgi:integral membrane protein